MYSLGFILCLLAYTSAVEQLDNADDNIMDPEYLDMLLKEERYEKSNETVEPEYLDMLLKEKRYDEFNEIMEIDVPHLSRPGDENEQNDPRFSVHLEHGDMLLTNRQREQARQGVRFDKHPNLRWSYVPFTISNDYSESEKRTIRDAINQFNSDVGDCIRWRPRRNEGAYVFIFPGNGCYSNVGRTGRQQSLSLQKIGCVHTVTILHEMYHAIGFIHEQCRYDRDDYIKVLYENIRPSSRPLFEKVSPNDFGIQGPYDYYTMMHHPQSHPDVSDDKKAFIVLQSGIDEGRIGRAQRFTDIDKQKIRKLYCGK